MIKNTIYFNESILTSPPKKRMKELAEYTAHGIQEQGQYKLIFKSLTYTIISDQLN